MKARPFNNGHDMPFQKQRDGKPAKTFEPIGPFTLQVANHGFYETYEVQVTGGITIMKQASRPSYQDVVRSLGEAATSGRVPWKVYDDYKQRATDMEQQHKRK